MFKNALQVVNDFADRVPGDECPSREVCAHLMRATEVASVAYRLDLDPEEVNETWRRFEPAQRMALLVNFKDLPAAREVYSLVENFTLWS